MSKSNTLNNQKQFRLSICAILVGMLFLIWRARYGYCFNDEPFVLTLAHRLLRGSKLIMDEWNAAQLFGIVNYPMVSFYYVLTGSTEGILLFARYIFCLAWFLTSICVYAVFRKYSRFAIAAYVYLILFAPLDYMTCSYTSFGLMGVLLLGCLYLRVTKKEEKQNWVFTGIASSFLCCVIILSSPFFMIVYCAAVVVLPVVVRRKSKRNSKYYYSIILTNLVSTSLIGALCVYTFVLRGHTVQELFARLPYIFADPTHTDSFLEKTIRTIAAIYRPMLFLYVIGVLLLSAYALTKKRGQYRLGIAVYWACIFLFSRVAIANIVLDQYSFNYEMFDLGILGFAAFILLDKKPWGVFYSFSILGLLYAICTFIASNTKLMSLSAAIVPCGVAGIVYLFLLAQEVKEKLPSERKASAIVLVCAMLLCQFSLQICVRTNRQYWDAPLPYLTEKIEVGAAKGLITTPEQRSKYETDYEAVCALLENVEDRENMLFLNLTSNPVIYLDADLKYGTFSTWTFGYGERLSERFQQYFGEVPENVPDLVYFTDEEEELTSILNLGLYQRYDYGEHHLLVKDNG